MEWFRPPGAGPVIYESNREIIFMILQFLREEKFKELEQESGLFFDIKYFKDQVEAGKWEEVEQYLSGFLKVNDNDESRTIFFEISKQKYLEVLDRKLRKPEADRHLEIMRFYLQSLQVLLGHLAYISRRLETDKTKFDMTSQK